MYGVITRMKRVTDPLDDRVKARIVSIGPAYASSGSEYSAHADDDVNVDDLFFNFSVDDSDESSPAINESNSKHDPPIDVIVDLINPISLDQGDPFQKLLLDQVSKALQMFTCLKSNNQMLRRNVMAFLRNRGYNAAICKTKWERCGGLTAGNHEFIDVIRTEYSVRYFVDLDFASEFEIARPTSSYEQLVKYIPSVFVGKSEDLKPILKIVSDAVKRSLKSKGLLLPPWRKHRFMQNKWFGPYKRTMNLYPGSCSSSSTDSVKQSYRAAECRDVGFDASVSGGRSSFSVTARTR